MVQQCKDRHQEKMKQLARNQEARIVGRQKRLETLCLLISTNGNDEKRRSL
jgi:hypothetical protein